jgi:hypothetical protein
MRRPLRTGLALLVLSLASAGKVSAQFGEIQFGQDIPFQVARSPEYLATGDMNLDGVTDVIASSPLSSKITVLLGGGPRGFMAQTALDVPNVSFNAIRQPGVGDLNQDGFPDVVVTDSRRNVGVILLGNGDGTLGRPGFIATGRGPFGATVGQYDDIAGNDIVVSNSTDNTVSLFLNRGEVGRAAFNARVNFPTNSRPQLVLTADFNDDLVDDILAVNTGNFGANDATVFICNGVGGCQRRGDFSVGDGAQQATVGDFNNDFFPDLAIASGRVSSQQVFSSSFTVLIGGDTGFFTNPRNTPVDCNDLVPDTRICLPRGITVGDFDLDGNLDIAVAVSFANSVLIYAGDGTGNFDLVGAPIRIGGNPSFMASGDFNDDGLIDLAIAEVADPAQQGTVRLLLNTTELPPPLPGSPTPTGTPTGQGPGDGTATPTITGTRNPPAETTQTPGRKAQGETCGSDEECQSLFCEQGRCCNRACNGQSERCDQNPPGQCVAVTTSPTRIASPTRRATDGGSSFAGRSSGCSTDASSTSPLSEMAVLLVPFALWLGRRRSLARASIRVRPRHRSR